MPKFYFSSVSLGASTTYPLSDCEDIAEAKDHARGIAAGLIATQVLAGEVTSGWVEISDKQGRTVFMLPLAGAGAAGRKGLSS